MAACMNKFFTIMEFVERMSSLGLTTNSCAVQTKFLTQSKSVYSVNSF